VNAWTRQEFREWRQAANTQRRKHEIQACLWFAFGVIGVTDYVHRHGLQLSDGVASSIPIIFLISVMAMYQGERTQAGTFRVEQKQEEAQESAHE